MATGEAGLYRATEGETTEPNSVEMGVIVLPDGSHRGATNFVNSGGDSFIEPIIDANRPVTSPLGRLSVRPLSPGFIDPNMDFA